MAETKKVKPARIRADVFGPQDDHYSNPYDDLGYTRHSVEKSDKSEQLTHAEELNAGDWIEHPLNMYGLKAMVDQSEILPQCIEVYAKNIAGFGISIDYAHDSNQEETNDMEAEYNALSEIVELLNIDKDTKEVFEDVIRARETYGIAYVEVIRDLEGNVVQVEFIKDTPSIDMTKPCEPYLDVPYYHHGIETTRKKKFRRFRQQIGAKTVYFKEFGDPRIMDKRDGLYLEDGQTLELEYQANEILDFPIGTEPYGLVRWFGEVLGVDGARRAEILNNNYFKNGRHTPLAITVTGGSLTEESRKKLQEYMNQIQGENGQHKFLLLEAESDDSRTDFDESEKPNIEIHDIANILQKDGLFHQYQEDKRHSVQSAFRLPDIYLGYTSDYNRDTSQMAQELTEQQVFQPERISLAWKINNVLLNGYRLHYCEITFNAPKITNPTDTINLMNAANQAGGLTPNKAKDILYEYLGETSEDFEEDWGNVPLPVQSRQSAQEQNSLTSQLLSMRNSPTPAQQAQQRQPATDEEDEDELQDDIDQVTKSIRKAEHNGDDDVVLVMREVRKQLQKMQEAMNEDQA